MPVLYHLQMYKTLAIMLTAAFAVAALTTITTTAIAQNVEPAYAQLSKDDGASAFAPRGNEPPVAGGWMPMERPGVDPNGAAEDNPGQQAIDSGIIGCANLKCTSP